MWSLEGTKSTFPGRAPQEVEGEKAGDAFRRGQEAL
jgi:hypothetical protein